MAYTIQEVTDRIVELKINVVCEACNSDTGWTLPEDSGSGNVQELSMLAEGQVLRFGATRIVTFIPMICQNCGYTRHFQVHKLMGGDAK